MRTVARKAVCVLLALIVIAGGVSAIPAKITASAANSAAQKIVSIAQNEIGYREQKNNITKYGKWYGAQVAWCCIFVSWCTDQADKALGTNMYGTIIPKTGNGESSRNFFKNLGRYHSRSSGYSPAVGDFIYFNWQTPSGRAQHIGIVTGVSDGTVYTVEGNSSDSVRSRSYSMSSSKILGYAHPNYESVTGGKSSDTNTTAKKDTTTTTKKNATTTTTKNATTKQNTMTTTTQAAQPKLSLNTASVEMRVGKTVTLNATLRNAARNQRALTWSSSKPSVATVSSDGVITAVSDGNAVITVKSAGGLTAQCKITVKNPTKDIYLNFETSNIFVDSELKLEASTEPENTTDTMTWESSDEEVATVSDDGIVTGVAPGEATISVTASSGKTASCEITVEPQIILLEEVYLDKDFEAVNVGDVFQLDAIITPVEATEQIIWESSNEEVATVSESGEVTAVGGGSATITVTSESGATATCIVSVKVPTKSLYFEETNVNLDPGNIYKMSPVLSQDDTTDVLIWYSSDFSVAVISPDGEIIAIGSGTTTVKVETSGGISAECLVVVS